MTDDGALLIKSTQVFDGRRLRFDLVIRRSDDDRCSLVSVVLWDVDAILRLDGFVSGGFVDLQVNGAGEVFFTYASKRLEQAANAVMEAKEIDGILGLHIEGPYISSARRGTHSPEFIRPFDHQTLAAVERLRLKDILLMITLSPEAGTVDDISTLSDMGVIVSFGHINPNLKETER